MEWLSEFGGIGNMSAITVLVLVVLGVIFGKILPEKTHMRIVEAKDQQIATLTSVTGRQAGQVDKLVEQGESTLKILQALRLPDEEGSS